MLKVSTHRWRQGLGAHRYDVRRAMVLGLLACVLSPVTPAQGLLGFTLDPSLEIGVDSTANLSGRNGSGGREGVVATVTPGLRLVGRSGRVQGALDFAVSGVFPVHDLGATSIQNRLTADLSASVIPNHFDVNVAGSVRRQPTSISGTQAADGRLTNVNQSEVATVSVQPVLRTVLGGVVDVEAQATAGYTTADTQGFGATNQSAGVTLSSASGGSLFGWSVTADRRLSTYKNARQTTEDRIVASILFRPDVDWEVVLRAGQERNDVVTAAPQTYDTLGVGLHWTPTPRTQLSIDADQRYFGDGYAIAARHRLRRLSFGYVGSRGLSDSTGSGVFGISAYELYFELFASQEPDPVLRDVLVRSFLQRNGIPPQTVIGGVGFLTSAKSVQERHQLSVAYTMPRTTLTATWFRSRSERVDTVSGTVDDLTLGPVAQQGGSLILSHRLSPSDSVNLSGNVSFTRPVGGFRADSRLYSLTASWTQRVSERVGVTLGVRHSDYASDGSAAGYTSTSIITALDLRF